MISRNPDERRPLRMPGIGNMKQAKPGGLVLPDHVARQTAAKEARHLKPHMLYHCPTAGAQELPEGVEITVLIGPVPALTPQGVAILPNQPSPWAKCPVCGEDHMCAIVLTPVTDAEATDGPATEDPKGA